MKTYGEVMHRALRLCCETTALHQNYAALGRQSHVPVAAAVKANGYGLGARKVAQELLAEGCRDFFVSTWAEAEDLAFLPPGTLAVLHGVGSLDVPLRGVRPVLNSPSQVRHWKAFRSGASVCDVMIDTGMNRLGISLDDLAILDGLNIHTLHSHLACADEDHPLNALQLSRFKEVRRTVKARRFSLANSAGIFLSNEYAFDMVRPGLALYGGIPRDEAKGCIKPVARLEAQVLQCRCVRAGQSVGYNATFVAQEDLRIAILNIGYADGYRRAFSSLGSAKFDGMSLPVVGRVSMDLLAIDVSSTPALEEGDWVALDFELYEASHLTGLSQYELLTGLGQRYERLWS